MDDREFKQLIKQSGLPVEKLDPQKATSQAEGRAPHQGVIALVSLTGLVLPYEKFIEQCEPDPDTCLVFASEIQDPHNLGAIIRSAAAFGASAVLMPTHNQAPITGAVVKASAGMAFHLPLVSVENTQQAISQLKKKGFRVYGLAGEGKTSVAQETFDAPTIFILGNEGQGIPQFARVVCDKLLAIDIHEGTESLNVAASSAVALYAWSTQHPNALT
jgi:23S rRNA (guanosine2251-2'-O)-methyltransferase